MGIISIEKADELLWLGRYTERVYTTLRMFYVQFDKMIDHEENQFEEYCNNLNIPIIYKDNEDFVFKYLFDTENEDSVISNLTRAYDNAIVLRDEIGTETLSYLQLCLMTMEHSKDNRAPLMKMQEVLDMLLAFWACADDFIINERVRNLIKTGKSIERIDLYLRLNSPESSIMAEYRKLTSRIRLAGVPYKEREMIRFSYLLECELEDHPETKVEDRKHRMIDSIENVLA